MSSKLSLNTTEDLLQYIIRTKELLLNIEESMIDSAWDGISLRIQLTNTQGELHLLKQKYADAQRAR